MLSKTNIIIGSLFIAVLILSYIVLYRKPETEIQLFDDQPYRDSIAQAMESAVYWKDYAVKMEEDRDEITKQKQQVRYVYKPQYIYIYDADVTIDQLDSIIRAN
jgi:hypothetical protein